MKILSRLFPSKGLSCEQVAAVLQQYLDGELEPDQVPAVLEHLDACRDCGLEAELYSKIKNSLHTHRYQPDQASIDRLAALAGELAETGLADRRPEPGST